METRNKKCFREDLNEKLPTKKTNSIKYNQSEKIKYKKYFHLKGKNINRIKFVNFIRLSAILVILNLFTQIQLSTKINFNLSNITLKIKGKGNRYILTSETDWFTRSNYPKIIKINGKIQTAVNNFYYLEQDDNIVELIWENNNIIIVIVCSANVEI